MSTFAGHGSKPRALTLLIFISLVGVLRAQTPAPETKDPLGRTTPQGAVFQFLEACHVRDYSKAIHYLDLRHMPAAERAKQGPELAAQLEDLLDDTAGFRAALELAPPATLSRLFIQRALAMILALAGCGKRDLNPLKTTFSERGINNLQP